MEGFMCKIEGIGLICKKKSKTRGLGVKSAEEKDCELICKKARGRFAKP
jgi:hypothetical protein